jgi:hypothetical protein
VLSEDADASETGGGRLKDSKSGADAGRGPCPGNGAAAGAGEGSGEGEGAGSGRAVVVGRSAAARRTAVFGGSTTCAGKLLPHDWQLVWPRKTSLAPQNGQTGSVDP